MKKELVPQDDAGYLKEGRVRDLCYAVDENDHYTTVFSLGWEPKNEAIRQAWLDIEEQLEKVKKEIEAGVKSPLAWFMQKNIMDVGLLSKYTGIPRRKIRKHLRPAVFEKLEKKVLDKYSVTFGLTPEQLHQPDFLLKH